MKLRELLSTWNIDGRYNNLLELPNALLVLSERPSKVRDLGNKDAHRIVSLRLLEEKLMKVEEEEQIHVIYDTKEHSLSERLAVRQDTKSLTQNTH